MHLPITGAKGTKGIPGEFGLNGSQGPKGLQGDQGRGGEAGPAGTVKLTITCRYLKYLDRIYISSFSWFVC